MITKNFRPDLIVEVTNGCNRSCPGCYAPNVLVKDGTAKPSGAIFLSSDVLQHEWNFDHKIPLVSIRGGEPTLNSDLSAILNFISERSESVYLETNGDWIGKNEVLIQELRATSTIVKLSIDSMHGSTPTRVRNHLEILKEAHIQVAVAITEADEDAFEKSASLLPDWFNGEIIYQKKAVSLNELVAPSIGVINTRGVLKASVTSKFASRISIFAWLALLWSTIGLMSSQAHAEVKKVSIGIAANFSEMTDSTSNPYANYFRNAIQLAIKDNKKKLAEKGLEIFVKEFDYAGQNSRIISTANDAVKSDVLGVVGYIYSTESLLAGPIFNDNHLLLITPTSTADRVGQLGRYVRRTCFTDSQQGGILANFAIGKRIKTVAILSVADCAYCQSLRTSFSNQFIKAGGKVIADETVLSTDSDLKSVAGKFAATHPDAILIPNYERASATMLANLFDQGVRPRLWLGGDGWGNTLDLFYSIVGSRKFDAYTISHWDKNETSAASKHFVATFEQTFGKAPIDTAVLAYDAMSLLIKGILSASSLNRLSVLESVERIQSFDGVTGHMTYPKGDRTPHKSAVVLKLKDHKVSFEKVLK